MRTIWRRPFWWKALWFCEIALFAWALRWGFGPSALNREEGELAYMAQRAQAGELPYRDWPSGQAPLNHLAYRAAFLALGVSEQAVRWLGLLAAWAALAAFLWTSRLWLKDDERLFGTCALALLSCQPQWAFSVPELFVLAPMILAVGLAGRPSGPRTLFGIGACLAAASLFKPLAGLGLVCALLPWARRREWTARNKARLAAGFAFPALMAVSYFAAPGALGPMMRSFLWDARDWAAYPLPGGLKAVHEALRDALRFQSPVLLAAAAGALLAWRSRRSEKRGLLFAWLGGTGLAMAAGRHFFPWHWLIAAPALACLAGLGMRRLAARLHLSPAALAAAMILLAQVNALLAGRFFLDMIPGSWASQDRPPNPALTVAARLREITTEQDPVLVFGSEPQILFYARRQSTARSLHYDVIASPYWGPALRAQKELEQDIRAFPPAAIVLVRYPDSLPISEQTPRYLPDRLNALLAAEYALDTAGVEDGRDWRFSTGFAQADRAMLLASRPAPYLVYRREARKP